jgi:dihydroflavonol-4-reductase
MNSPKRLYLLTGAAGNLGSSIARQLIQQGKHVRGLILQGDPAAKRVPKEVELLVGDITAPASLPAFFDSKGYDETIVIHTAGIVTVFPDYSKKVYDVNVIGTKNIVDACVASKVKKLVYIGSTGAIPDQKKKKPIVEVDRYDPETVIGFYGKTKAEASQIVLDAVRERGLDASIICPTGIFGPGDYAYGPVVSFVIDYAKGGLPAGVAGSFNAADVRDLAAGAIACVDRGRSGESYIMGNDCVTMRDMFKLISAASGAPEVKLIIPAWIAYAMAAISGAFSAFSRTRSVFTTFAVYNLVRNNAFSSEKAKRELGYSSRPFAQTMADVVAWLIEEGKISDLKKPG